MSTRRSCPGPGVLIKRKNILLPGMGYLALSSVHEGGEDCLVRVTAYSPAAELRPDFPSLRLPVDPEMAESSGLCCATSSWYVAVPSVAPARGPTTGTHHQPLPALPDKNRREITG